MNMTCTIEKTKLLSDAPAAILMADGKTGRFPGSDATALYIEEIHARAETVTPLLKNILEFRPHPHWGN